MNLHRYIFIPLLTVGLVFCGENNKTTSQFFTPIPQNNSNPPSTVHQKKWIYPSDLSDHKSVDGFGASIHQIAIDNQGNMILVWNQFNGTDFAIYKAEFRNRKWTTPSSINDAISFSGSYAGEPQVAMNDNGEAIILWSQQDATSNNQVYKAEYQNGIWTFPTSLSDTVSFSGSSAGSAKVVLNNEEHAIIVWVQNDGSSFRLYKAEKENNVWAPPTSISDSISPAGPLVGEAFVDLNDGAGIAEKALVAWYQNDGTEFHIYKAEKNGGVWTIPSNLLDNISPTGSDAYNPQVAVSDNGQAAISWYQNDGSFDQIYQANNIQSGTGAWTQPAALVDNISPDGTNAINPRVGISNAGDVTIVWQQADPAYQQIFKAEFRSGIWNFPSSTSSFISLPATDAQYPSIAVDNDNRILITWTQRVGSVYEMFKANYDSTKDSWSFPTTVDDAFSPDGIGDAYSPHVAFENDRAIISWVQWDGLHDQIYTAEYR